MTNKKLYRNEDEAIFAGVCSGLADYFDIDVTLVRVIFVLLVLGGGSGLLIYIILWIVTPIKNQIEIINKEKVSKKVKTMAKEIKKDVKVEKKRSGSFMGFILMGFGILILLDKLIPVVIRWDYVWPILLVVSGAYLIFRD